MKTLVLIGAGLLILVGGFFFAKNLTQEPENLNINTTIVRNEDGSIEIIKSLRSDVKNLETALAVKPKEVIVEVLASVVEETFRLSPFQYRLLRESLDVNPENFDEYFVFVGLDIHTKIRYLELLRNLEKNYGKDQEIRLLKNRINELSVSQLSTDKEIEEVVINEVEETIATSDSISTVKKFIRLAKPKGLRSPIGLRSLRELIIVN